MKRTDDYQGRGRHYSHPVTGHHMPSVTTICGKILPAPWAMPWAAKVERELCMSVVKDVYRDLNGDRVTMPEFMRRVKEAMPREKAHKAVASSTSAIGNEAHELINWRLRGELGLERGPEPQPSEPALWSVASFEDWRREVDFKPTHSEERLYSDDLDSAGATDAIACELSIYIIAPKKRRISAIADWKTGPIREHHDIQVAVYRHMAIERGLLTDEAWALILSFPRTLEDPQFKFRLVPPSECRRLVDVFRAQRVVWDWWQKAQAETR